MRNKAIVIHYLGDGLSPTAKPLRNRWISKSGIPSYDFGIEANGERVTGRSLGRRGAHAAADKFPYNQWLPKGTLAVKPVSWWFNENAIGVVVCQGLPDPLPGVMYHELIQLLRDLTTEHKIPAEHIYLHGDIFNTSCPGWLKTQKARLLTDIYAAPIPTETGDEIPAPHVHLGPAYPGRIFDKKNPGEKVFSVQVGWIQQQLRNYGHDVKVDGYFGGNTALGVWNFQGDKKLFQDSRVGPVTWAALWP